MGWRDKELIKDEAIGPLRSIFNIHRPDKIPFIDIYERMFAPFKETTGNVFEIGVQYGPSMLMWCDYFKHAKILGMDIDPECVQRPHGRAQIYIGAQADLKILDTIIKDYTTFDIIIDDGSHKRSDQMASFNYLLPHIRSGGLYVIEDIGSTSEATFNDQPFSPLDLIHQQVVDLQIMNMYHFPGDPYHQLHRATIEQALSYPDVAAAAPKVMVKAIHVFKELVFFERL